MWPIYIAFLVSVAIAALAGYAHLNVEDYLAGADRIGEAKTLLREVFKATLAFSLVAAAGGVIKIVGERVLDSRRDQQAQARRKEERRQEILHEFTALYSEFYSLRKLWESAYSTNNQIYSAGTQEFRTLVRTLLERSVELEGRYGGVKLAAIRHFGLPSGDYTAKSVEELEAKIRESSDPNEMARLRLDLLGEGYDDWRHALELNREIHPIKEVWQTYEALLEYFESIK